MNTDEVDEVVKLMDLRFRTVCHDGKEIVFDTREEARKPKHLFFIAGSVGTAKFCSQ